jgi:hypothetical protein
MDKHRNWRLDVAKRSFGEAPVFAATVAWQSINLMLTLFHPILRDAE